MRSGRLRGAQQSREWLGDCSGDAEEGLVYRIRLIGPISAGFAVLVGDAIRNLRVVTRPGWLSAGRAALWSVTEDAERMTELPIRISGAQFDDWRLRRTNRRSCAARRSSGSGVPDDSLGTAVGPSGLRRSANDRGRTPLADRRRLRGTTMSASSSTGCGMSTSTDAYLCWRPRLPAKAALGWRHGRAHHAGSCRGDAGGGPRSGRPPRPRATPSTGLPVRRRPAQAVDLPARSATRAPPRRPER